MALTQQAPQKVICDGCGRGATSEHIARRLERLEQTTRYRPVHIQAVFLSAQSPESSDAFLYGALNGFCEEAASLLYTLQIEHEGRGVDAALAEFQRKGFFLTHVLECAPDSGIEDIDIAAVLKQKMPGVARRLRTSLRPKRIFLISKEMIAVSGELKAAQIGAELVLDGDAPFDLDDAGSANRLRSVL